MLFTNKERDNHMDKSIKVSIKYIYGARRIYPVCDDAKAFARIAGTKTLSRDVLDNIKMLGYSIVVEAELLTEAEQVRQSGRY